MESTPTLRCCPHTFRDRTLLQLTSRNVKISNATYAATLRLVRTTTTFPLVRNLTPCQHRCAPSTPHRISSHSPLPTQTILPNLAKELPITLHSPESTGSQDPGPIDSEQSPNGVELRGEDLENDEGEGKLGERGADVGALEGALSGADFDEFGAGRYVQ